MEEDEFNEFQQPVTHQPQIAQELSSRNEQQIKDQGDLFANNFFNFDAKNNNPSSSLATMTFQQLSDNIESKDSEDTNWPHLNKIQSQNLPALEPHLITFQKSHSQSQHKIDLFDFSAAFISESKTVTEQIPSQTQEVLVTQQIPNINQPQNSKLDLDFNFSASIEVNSAPINQNLQSNYLDFGNDFFNKEKATKQVQFGQNKQVVMQEKQKVLSQQVQDDKARKQSEQFVFSQPVQIVTFQANNINNRKQSEQFVFQQQTRNQLTPSTLVSVDRKQKLADFEKVQQQNFNEVKTDNQEHFTQTKQENHISNPILVNQSQKMNLQIEEEDQFGDFEETVPNTVLQLHPAILGTQIKTQSQPSIVEIYESQIPFGVNQFSKKNQLQELVDSLPNYSTIFAKAFELL